MSKSAKRLGRGLNSLVSNLRAEAPPVAEVERSAPPDKAELPHEATDPKSHVPVGLAPASVEHRGPQTTMLPVNALSPNPYQPRNTIREEEIKQLAASIKQSGMLQPITARLVSGRHQLIAGERRWRAAQAIGMTEVPVIVREATDEQMIEFALIENLQREDLNAIDRAKAYRQFCDSFGLKPEEVGQRLGEDRTTVVNYLRLLDLADEIQAMVAEGRLSMGHARCLLGIADEARRRRLAESAVASDLSVRALEEIVRREKTRRAEGEVSARPAATPRSAHLRDIERRFEEAVKTKVTIHESKRKGRGRVVIEYYSFDDFDRISSLLGVNLD